MCQCKIVKVINYYKRVVHDIYLNCIGKTLVQTVSRQITYFINKISSKFIRNNDSIIHEIESHMLFRLPESFTRMCISYADLEKAVFRGL